MLGPWRGFSIVLWPLNRGFLKGISKYSVNVMALSVLFIRGLENCKNMEYKALFWMAIALLKRIIW
jgi:hypothetical protein